ncbi:MAG: Rrf2 family transcriptional regulator [Bacteroidia bacterium]|nr:Rrf2 family transcriptional regulator [Bacteroidia bacterium]
MSKVLSLSEAAFIALHGMILVARSDKNYNVIRIAEDTSASKHHVAKIMQRLVKDDFLNSSRGPNGGFSLKKKPADISFLDIYESIEGKIEMAECPMNKLICSFEQCIFNNITNTITLQFKNYLADQTLDKYL